ncbi:hypothetical protein EHS86_15165 [Erwinia amylovora]|nr:hypothetical protein AD997_00695 [Erwinia amylovora]RUT14721.1 hypothetical protein BEI72_14710 [Erwinia amylovora]RWS37311.1 hypothetical protein EHS86_15165 [Erwinia amylovora]
MPEVSGCHIGMAPLFPGYIGIILTVIAFLLNLYAKTFRSPDVLTSIFRLFTLYAFSILQQELMHHDA